MGTEERQLVRNVGWLAFRCPTRKGTQRDRSLHEDEDFDPGPFVALHLVSFRDVMRLRKL